MGDFAKRKRREGDGRGGEVGDVGADCASKPIRAGCGGLKKRTQFEEEGVLEKRSQ